MADKEPTLLEWLLMFVRADLHHPTPGAVLDFAWGIIKLPRLVSDRGARSLTGLRGEFVRPTEDGWEGTTEAVAKVQTEIRRGLARLESGDDWMAPELSGRMRLTPDPRPGVRLVRKRYGGTTTSAFYQAASDLIAGGWPRIRRCENPDCRQFFFMTDLRQTYCVRRCSDHVRQVRHKPKRKRHTVTTG